MSADQRGPRWRFRTDALGQQLSESCCHCELALVHIIWALAIFPSQVCSLSIGHPLSST
jgi:hypothetical protein